MSFNCASAQVAKRLEQLVSFAGIYRADCVLTLIRVIHTVVWAFFVSLILVLPVLGWLGQFFWAAVVIGLVLLEGLILLANRGHCPLTDIAARYTENRAPNFDIYLSVWLARNNKLIFSTLFVGGAAYVLWCWITA